MVNFRKMLNELLSSSFYLTKNATVLLHNIKEQASSSWYELRVGIIDQCHCLKNVGALFSLYKPPELKLEQVFLFLIKEEKGNLSLRKVGIVL